MEADFSNYFADFLHKQGFNREINIFDYELNAIVRNFVLSADKIVPLVHTLSDYMDTHGFGLIMADKKLDWIAVQPCPVDWGVFAFNGSSEPSAHLFELLDKDYFLQINDFKNTKRKDLIPEFGEDCIAELLKNYDRPLSATAT